MRHSRARSLAPLRHLSPTPCAYPSHLFHPPCSCAEPILSDPTEALYPPDGTPANLTVITVPTWGGVAGAVPASLERWALADDDRVCNGPMLPTAMQTASDTVELWWRGSLSAEGDRSTRHMAYRSTA